MDRMCEPYIRPRRKSSPRHAQAAVRLSGCATRIAFLVCDTYRFHGHHVGDIKRDYYRPKQEELKWKTERDPVKLLSDWLISQNLADQAQITRIDAEVQSEVEKAVQFAIDAPYPTPDKVDQDIYA